MTRATHVISLAQVKKKPAGFPVGFLTAAAQRDASPSAQKITLD